MNDEYFKNSLMPCLKELKRYKSLDRKFNIFKPRSVYDAQLILKINAQDEDYDLSKPNVQVPKLSINKWTRKYLL